MPVSKNHKKKAPHSVWKKKQNIFKSIARYNNSPKRKRYNWLKKQIRRRFSWSY